MISNKPAQRLRSKYIAGVLLLLIVSTITAIACSDPHLEALNDLDPSTSLVSIGHVDLPGKAAERLPPDEPYVLVELQDKTIVVLSTRFARADPASEEVKNAVLSHGRVAGNSTDGADAWDATPRAWVMTQSGVEPTKPRRFLFNPSLSPVDTADLNQLLLAEHWSSPIKVSSPEGVALLYSLVRLRRDFGDLVRLEPVGARFYADGVTVQSDDDVAEASSALTKEQLTNCPCVTPTTKLPAQDGPEIPLPTYHARFPQPDNLAHSCLPPPHISTGYDVLTVLMAIVIDLRNSVFVGDWGDLRLWIVPDTTLSILPDGGIHLENQFGNAVPGGVVSTHLRGPSLSDKGACAWACPQDKWGKWLCDVKLCKEQPLMLYDAYAVYGWKTKSPDEQARVLLWEHDGCWKFLFWDICVDDDFFGYSDLTRKETDFNPAQYFTCSLCSSNADCPAGQSCVKADCPVGQFCPQDVFICAPPCNNNCATCSPNEPCKNGSEICAAGQCRSCVRDLTALSTQLTTTSKCSDFVENIPGRFVCFGPPEPQSSCLGYTVPAIPFKAGASFQTFAACRNEPHELCNGIDDNCDGLSENIFPPLSNDPAIGTACVPGGIPVVTPGELVCTGTELVCNYVPDLPDICDGKDTNLNGLDGESDPLVGKPCGPNVGACTAGAVNCVAGKYKCVGGTLPVPEVCSNGIDDSCNGSADESPCVCLDGSTRACGNHVGECKPGTQTCAVGKWGPCIGAIGASAEVCDGKDNNCNNAIDDGCLCNPPDTRSCGLNVGECNPGIQNCVNNGQTFTWGLCTGYGGPKSEICNGLDDDCNGKLDDFTMCSCGTTKPCGANVGVCTEGIQTCNDGQWSLCNGAGPTEWPDEMSCDGLDNDCDSNVDENLPGTGLPCNTGIPGVCALGIMQCDSVSNNIVCTQTNFPTPEENYGCNGFDDDCDGQIDNRAVPITCGPPDSPCQGLNWDICSTSCAPNYASAVTEGATPRGPIDPPASIPPGYCDPNITCGHPDWGGTCKPVICTDTNDDKVCDLPNCLDGIDNDCDGCMDSADGGCWPWQFRGGGL
ncbi:MAG TPA: MopE-related protein [Polyangiaceae bacterium]|nr:MopE-related protein [Polyangiaceae bacterium]